MNIPPKSGEGNLSGEFWTKEKTDFPLPPEKTTDRKQTKNQIKTPHHDKSPYNRAIQYFETFTKSNLSPDIDRKTDIHEQKCKNRGNQYGQNLADERNHAQQNHADQIDKKKIGQKKRPFSEESQTIQDPVPACSGFQ